MRRSQVLIFVILLFAFWSCQTETDKNKLNFSTNGRYLFLGHTYHWYSNNKIDFRVQALNKEEFEMLLLGGDLCSATSKTEATLNHVDEVYNVGNPNVLWALGNHDLEKGNLAKIEKHTGRKSYYAQYKNGITFLVLNTNLDHTKLSVKNLEQEYDKQFKLILKVTDTISKSSHLLVLGHNVVWKGLDSTSRSFANVSKPYSFCADSSRSFIDDIYPQLIKVQQKEIPVIWLAGDIGRWSKNYGYTSAEGIQFLASGINNTRLLKNPDLHPNPPKDKVLILNHDKENKTLTWNFVDLNFLFLLSQVKEKEFSETRSDSLCLLIDSLYRYQEEAISVYSKRILSTRTWREKVEEKAKQRGFSMEEMLYRDARFLNDKIRKEKLQELYRLVPNPLFNYANNSPNSPKHIE